MNAYLKFEEKIAEKLLELAYEDRLQNFEDYNQGFHHFFKKSYAHEQAREIVQLVMFERALGHLNELGLEIERFGGTGKRMEIDEEAFFLFSFKNKSSNIFFEYTLGDPTITVYHGEDDVFDESETLYGDDVNISRSLKKIPKDERTALKNFLWVLNNCGFTHNEFNVGLAVGLLKRLQDKDVVKIKPAFREEHQELYSFLEKIDIEEKLKPIVSNKTKKTPKKKI